MLLALLTCVPNITTQFIAGFYTYVDLQKIAARISKKRAARIAEAPEFKGTAWCEMLACLLAALRALNQLWCIAFLHIESRISDFVSALFSAKHKCCDN